MIVVRRRNKKSFMNNSRARWEMQTIWLCRRLGMTRSYRQALFSAMLWAKSSLTTCWSHSNLSHENIFGEKHSRVTGERCLYLSASRWERRGICKCSICVAIRRILLGDMLALWTPYLLSGLAHLLYLRIPVPFPPRAWWCFGHG